MRDYPHMANKLKIMGHPVRLQILDMLRQGETCVCHIEQALDKRQAYISQQLMTLRDAGLVDSRKDGLQVYYRLVDDQVADLLGLLVGAQDTDGLDVLAGCKCPSCTTVLITDIHTP
jgi:DNA-binding transcriptional ArsR family regulator